MVSSLFKMIAMIRYMQVHGGLKTTSHPMPMTDHLHQQLIHFERDFGHPCSPPPPASESTLME